MDKVLIFSEDCLSVIGCDKSYSGAIIIPEGVEYIANNAFYGCESLTSIHIPDGVKEIGNGAFCRCFNLTSINIPESITKIGDSAFAGCEGLSSIIIPKSVERINDWTFSGCEAMTSIHIPEGITCIGKGAFNGCSNLISVHIPGSVNTICWGAFNACSSISSMNVAENNIIFDSRDNCNAVIETSTDTLIVGNKNTIIPTSIKSIGDCAFWGCLKLTSISIPDNIISIGKQAFFGCYYLTSIRIPASTISIGDDVFLRCNNLKEIIISKGTKERFEEMLPNHKDKLVEQERHPKELTSDRQLLLFFDTETTGLPSNWNAPSSDVTNWPRIVQISWIISNIRGQIISKQNYIVKPEGFSIPSEVSQIHGITTERALEVGEKLNNILDHFLQDIQQVSYVIGHNISFDKNVVEAEIYRKGSEEHLDEFVIDKYVDMLENKPTICTMLSSTNYCRIPQYNNRYKWPKLSELYEKLFYKELVDAHDSSVDIQATFDCFWKLVELGVIASVDAEDTINGKETPIHHNKMRFTSFYFNSSIYNGYGEPTSDFIKRLYTREWKLFVSNETPQDLIFNYPDTLHVMDKGRGISGSYTLKDKDSILLSIEGESLYLHCVYYNEEIIIFQFDQSNEHLLLYQKHLVFSSDNDIRNYLNRVKQHVDTQRRNARKQREIEIKERADSLIKDITRTDVEISDKRVSTLKTEMKQLASILGSEEAEKYQSYIDNAITENQNEKDKIAEELKKEREEKREKKEKFLKILSVRIVIALYVGLWAIALYCHLDNRWVQCYHLIGWSAFISFLCTIALYCLPMPKTYLKAKILFLVFCCIMIIAYFVYEEDWHKFRSCFTQDVLNPTRVDVYLQDNFVAQSGDRYLSETIFHLFDRAAKLNIRNQIKHSYDLCDLKMYLSDNKSGYYVEEAKGQLYYASDQLCRQAETLGDWKYIINNAPQEYKVDAEKNYARLDSLVWDNEELAYLNAKSLHTIEAYDKYLSRRFGNNNHSLEIGLLQVELKKYEEMMKRTDK